VSVPAHAAKKVTGPANLGHRDVRNGGTAAAGTYAFEVGEEVVTGWHFHDLHQLEYAFEGVAQVETATARFLLPPQQAVWIPAGIEHCTTLSRVRTLSVFFDPKIGLEAGDRVRVLPASPVIREMILHARRWPIGRPVGETLADIFFRTLGQLVVEELDLEMPLSLPTSREPVVAAAMAFTSDHLDDVTLGELCLAVGTSERSLRRAFLIETGMSWRQYLLESRLLKAMALLSEPGGGVLSVATAVGFQSANGLTRAFRRYTGETPYSYRQRVMPRR
jgi:AraC-like DNA-binding protein